LEEIDIDTSVGNAAARLFVHPAPKLSIISIDGDYPINQLLYQDQPIRFLRLVLYGKINFNHFPDHQLLGNLKHLCIKLYVETDISILLPSLETLTLWCGTHRYHGIEAPRLETLRIFGHLESALDLSRLSHFRSVRRIHYLWGIGKGDIQSLTTYIAQLPLVKEVTIVHQEKARVMAALAWMRGSSVSKGFTLKGYRAQYDDLDAWSQPYPYECNEKQIDHQSSM
jgi:hypothetical protein